MSVDQLKRRHSATRHRLSRLLAYTPVWRPRLLPLAVSIAISLLLWAAIIALIRWALLAI